MKDNQIKQELNKLQYLVKSFKITLKDMNRDNKLKSIRRMNNIIESTHETIKSEIFKQDYLLMESKAKINNLLDIEN